MAVLLFKGRQGWDGVSRGAQVHCFVQRSQRLQWRRIEELNAQECRVGVL